MWTVDSVGGRASSMEDLLAKLEVQHCRAAVLDWESKSADGRLVARLFFVCWCAAFGLRSRARGPTAPPLSLPPPPSPRLPRAASSRQKMAYACGKKALREQLDGVLDVHAQSHDEIKKAMGIEEAEDDGSDWEP